MNKLLWSVVAMVCLLAPANAQSSASSLEDFAKSYWTALQSGDTARIVSMIHPKALASFRKKADAYVNSLLVFDKFGGNLRVEFGVTTKEEFQKLSDSFVFEQFLKRTALEPGHLEIEKATKRELIGTIRERDDLAHLIYRSDIVMLDSQGNRLKTATFERHGEIIGIWTTYTFHDQDKDSAMLMIIKRDGAEWKVLTIEEFEKEIDVWTEGLDRQNEELKLLTTKPKQKKRG